MLCKYLLVFTHLTTLTGKLSVTDSEAKTIRKYVKDHELKIVIHAILNLNFCNPISKRYQWGLDNLVYDLEIARKLNAIGCIVHLGTRITKRYDLTRKECIKNYIKSLVYVVKRTPKCPLIMIETCSNQKNKIGGTLEEFAELYTKIPPESKKRVKICVDTAHIFEAGYEINTVDGVLDFFAAFNRLLGIKNLVVLHLNDSATDLGSTINRHEPLGKGYIFDPKRGGSMDALREIFNICYQNKITIILETKREYYKKELEKLKEFSKMVPKKKIQLKGGRKDIRKDVIKIFQKMAKFHSSLGKRGNAQTSFRARGYVKAIKSLEKSTASIYEGKDAKDLEGIGKGFQEKIDEIAKTGTLKLFKEVSENKGQQSREDLQKVIGIGPSRANALVKMSINSVPKLKKAVKEGRVDVTTMTELGLKYYNDLTKRIPRPEVLFFKEIIDKALYNNVTNKSGELIPIETHLAGSYRTGKKDSKDIDLIITVDIKQSLLDKSGIFDNLIDVLKEKKLLFGIMIQGVDKVMGLVKLPSSINEFKPHKVRHIDIRLISHSILPWYMMYFGSGIEFSRNIRQTAAEQGYRLDEFGLFDRKTGKRINFKVDSEHDIFKFLGVKYVAPEERV